MVAVRQAALVLHRQVEIFEPAHVIRDDAAHRPQTQGELGGPNPPQRRVGRFQHRLEVVHPGAAVMVAAVHQQPDVQAQAVARARRHQPPGDVGGVRAGFQPDPLFQHDVAHRETPDRHPPLQPERFQMDIPRRMHHAAGPAVAEQRNFPRVVVHQRGVGLGEDQPAIQRRPCRRDQQTMIAPGQGAGHGACGVAAQPVRQPPFASFRLRQIAAQRSAAANEIR